jgi:hypothetical protein
MADSPNPVDYRLSQGNMAALSDVEQVRNSSDRHELCRVETSGIEPPTSWLQTSERPVASGNLSELASSPSARCTARCTGEAESANGPTADPLADFAASLTAEQRQRLARLLASKREGGDDV